MPTPSSGPLRFSDLSLEYLNNSSATISMSQLGYGGNINKRNDCSDYARSNTSVPLHSIVANLPVYNGPGSNINMLQYYNRNAYSAPPNGTFVTSGDNLEYNFTSLLNSGRDYNPNQTKRGNALFMHITNSGKLYSNDTGSYAATIGTQNNTILYFKNTGSILGCGGVGGGGGTVRNGGGGGSNGGPALISEIYTILDNTGVIYGGGGGGGGGASGHQSWNECWVCGPSNAGGGGGGGGGGQSAVVVSGGGGGGGGPQGGNSGSAGGTGSETNAGNGGSGGGAGAPGASGGNGGVWGQNGGSGGGAGGGGGGAGGAGGDSFLFSSGAIVQKGTTGGFDAIGGPAGSLSVGRNPSNPSQTTFSGSYGLALIYDENSGAYCEACVNQVPSTSWSNVSPTTVAQTGSGMVINVNRIQSDTYVTDAYDESCGTCNYNWYYTASIVNGGSGYIPNRSVVRVNLDGNNIDFVVL